MRKYKKLTSKSGITIPKDLRAETGFFPGMAVDLVSTPDGVMIKAHIPVCRFCGSPEGVLKVQDIHICRACAKKVAEAVSNHE